MTPVEQLLRDEWGRSFRSVAGALEVIRITFEVTDVGGHGGRHATVLLRD